MAQVTEIDDVTMRSMSIGASFTEFEGKKISSLDFHRTDDLLVTASEDDSVRLYDTANAKLHITKNVVLTVYALHTIRVALYFLQDIIRSPKSPCSIFLCMIIDTSAPSKGTKTGDDSPRVVSLGMSPLNDSFMSGSIDNSVRIWDLRVNACQGIIRVRGRPTVAYDQQGLVFAVAMEGGTIKLYDSRSYDKGPFDTFLVGGDTSDVYDIKFSNDGKSMLLTTTGNNIHILDAYGGDKRCGFSVEPSPNLTTEATFTPDGQYVVSGSGDGNLHAWDISKKNEVASFDSCIGPVTCLKWAPRRVMFAAASTFLAFWIPDPAKLNSQRTVDSADASQ